MNRYIIFYVSLLIFCLLYVSCTEKLGTNMPSMNFRKLRKQIRPPYDFSKALLSYREKYGYWPKSELDFINFDRQAVNDIYWKDFYDWHLGEDSQDSIVVYFTHAPVFKNAHIGGVPIPAREVKIKTLFIHKLGAVKTTFDK